MCNKHQQIALGFTKEKVPVGTHMCLIFTSEEERRDSLLNFLLSGALDDERELCFSDNITEEELRSMFAENNLSYDEIKEKKAITVADASAVYFQNGVFDPERMLNLLTKYYSESLEMGFPASRVIGEMTPKIETVPGGERLLEYESRVSLLLEDHPVTTVCQYDAGQFDGATIMEVLKVHPKMIVNGMVVQNPFFIEPRDYLKGIGSNAG